MWPYLGQNLQGQLNLPCCPLLPEWDPVRMQWVVAIAAAGRKGLCFTHFSSSTSLTSSLLAPTSVCLCPPAVFVVRSPKQAGWWREAHQEGSTDSTLIDTIKKLDSFFEETRVSKVTFCWVTASPCLSVMLLTSLGFLAYCGAQPWCLLELDPALGRESSDPTSLLGDWTAMYSLDLALPEILPKKWWFSFFSHSSPPRRDLSREQP